MSPDPDPAAGSDAPGPRRVPEGLGPALAVTHTWFEGNSGWAPPDPETLADWLAEGLCRTPDDCWVDASGTCPHGLVSWQVVLDELAELDARRPGPGSGTRTGPGPGSGTRTGPGRDTGEG